MTSSHAPENANPRRPAPQSRARRQPPVQSSKQPAALDRTRSRIREQVGESLPQRRQPTRLQDAVQPFQQFGIVGIVVQEPLGGKQRDESRELRQRAA